MRSYSAYRRSLTRIRSSSASPRSAPAQNMRGALEREHDGARVEVGERVVERVDQRRVERVRPLGAVQPEPNDAVERTVDEQWLAGHQPTG